MIPEQNHAAVTSTVSGDAVAMSVDSSALAHIMSVLTNLYADPELAIIREYATNALDSHVAAGVSDPIEVTTPSSLRPVLSIRDRGLGLDADDIRETLSRYGASTKRESNEAVGMLGIGCKSALAYTDQFTITGVKNGQRTVVSVARDETGAGTMTALDPAPTDEPNGATIEIPARVGNEIERKAREFFAHWEPGAVLVDGVEPPTVEGLSVGEFVVREQNVGYGQANRGLIVMGNVPYPLPSDYEHDALAGLNHRAQVIARAEIGALQFAPSREALLDSPAVRAALDEIFDRFEAAVAKYAADEITAAPERSTALRRLHDLEQTIGRGLVPDGIKWRGTELPRKVEAREGKSLWRTYRRGAKGGGRSATNSVDALSALNGIWACNFTNGSWTGGMRAKLESYLEFHRLVPDDEYLYGREVYLTGEPTPPGGAWLDDALRVDWDDVRKWRDPALKKERGETGLSYPALTFSEDGRILSDWNTLAETLPDENLYYYVGSVNAVAARTALRAITDPDAVVVLVSTPRAKKFKRLFPHAIDVRETAKVRAWAWWRDLGSARQTAILTNGGEDRAAVRAATALIEAGAKDRRIAYFAGRSEVNAQDAREDYRSTFREWLPYDLMVPTGPRWESVEADYPLLSDHVGYRMDEKIARHLATYINAVHAAE